MLGFIGLLRSKFLDQEVQCVSNFHFIYLFLDQDVVIFF